MQVEEPKVGRVAQGLPGEERERVSVQPELVQVVETPEAVDVQRVQRVERHPEKLQVVEVVEIVAGNPGDCGFLNAELGCVSGEIGRDDSDFWIIAKHTPARKTNINIYYIYI